MWNKSIISPIPIKVFNLDLGDSLSYRFITVAPCKIYMIKNVIRLTSETEDLESGLDFYTILL